ncbi:excisionase family DNA binding protein [Rhizobium sp. BK316]|uniref:helix-turn-helix domain-containing protein n=1 Tax=Rhizobium sp. BK316 TaxID=2587053 RepID=UPI0016206463|nr:excisionase family DNA binding protein [Rhizobium sp. BK316]
MEVTPRILLNIRQVTEATGISRASIYRQVKAGQLPFVKVGSRTLFRPQDLQSFVDRSVRASALSRQPAEEACEPEPL